MVLTTKQLSIFQGLARQPVGELTRKALKEAAQEKSNNALSIALKAFVREGLIREKKVGKSSLFSLNWDNEKLYHYLALANDKRMDAILHRITKLIGVVVGQTTQFYSLVVFGSYAMGEQRETSDVDVAVFIENAALRKQVVAALKDAEMKSPLPLDAHVIIAAEFLEMLTNDEENLGKEIARKHIAIHNSQLFYGLLQEGIKHGFRI